MLKTASGMRQPFELEPRLASGTTPPRQRAELDADGVDRRRPQRVVREALLDRHRHQGVAHAHADADGERQQDQQPGAGRAGPQQAEAADEQQRHGHRAHRAHPRRQVRGRRREDAHAEHRDGRQEARGAVRHAEVVAESRLEDRADADDLRAQRHRPRRRGPGAPGPRGGGRRSGPRADPVGEHADARGLGPTRSPGASTRPDSTPAPPGTVPEPSTSPGWRGAPCDAYAMRAPQPMVHLRAAGAGPLLAVDAQDELKVGAVDLVGRHQAGAEHVGAVQSLALPGPMPSGSSRAWVSRADRSFQSVQPKTWSSASDAAMSRPGAR